MGVKKKRGIELKEEKAEETETTTTILMIDATEVRKISMKVIARLNKSKKLDGGKIRRIHVTICFN